MLIDERSLEKRGGVEMEKKLSSRSYETDPKISRANDRDSRNGYYITNPDRATVNKMGTDSG